MTTAAASLNRDTFNRPDTFFGVCEAIGQDFGFNPLWIRLAFVPALFFFPFQAPFLYIGLGLIVLASRLMFPAKPAAAAPAVDAAPVAPQTALATGHSDDRERQLALAA
ncbi:MAG: PspC domain-containing protein [Sphingopyxis sp.]|nr:PspC domain-containing protein [Sphingopyxis sp.]